MLCPSCHTPNRENAKFCKRCGYSFPPENSEASAVSTPPVPEQEQAGNHAPEVANGTPAVNEQAQAQESSAQAETIIPPPASTQVSTEHEEVDVSLAPTQILSPEKMVAYQNQRWQQEIERERAAQAAARSSSDIADAPTMFIRPGSDPFKDTALPATPSPASHKEPDIAEMPTILIPQGEIPAAVSSEALAEAGAPVVPSLLTEETVLPGTNQEDTKTNNTTAEAEAASSAPSPATEEEKMEQVTPPTENQTQPQEEQIKTRTESTEASETFPVQSVGTLISGRYEVAEVLGESTEEHTYSVIDRQGYQRCWNCASEENAEGDEFCIACGAELLNASYILHEYSSASAGSDESNVLQGTIVNTFVDQERTYVVEQPQATQSAFPNGVRLLAATESDAGNVRRSEPNEDSTLVLQLERVHGSNAIPVGTFIVADGMGGHDNGQLASRMAIGTFTERIVREILQPPLTTEKAGQEVAQMDEEQLVTILQGAVEDANTAICQVNQRDKTDMGCTITGFMIVGDLAYILNVGDSRTYMYRDGKLYQLTNDHSLVGQLVAGGLIEPDDVYTHPQRSQIYRSLGDKLNVQVDIFKQQIHPGDILLSCSDGLWEMVRNPQIAEILNAAPDPQTACTQLIEAANANGGDDNVSVVIVSVR
jgi:serine/threonine protein phosphatase PrpC